MGIAVISAVVAALGLICAANPAAAQSKQNSTPSHLLLPQSSFANATSSATTTPTSPDARNVLSPKPANAFGLLKDHVKKPSRLSDPQLRIVPPKQRLQAKALPPAGTCAHILIHRIWTPDSNPMVIEPKGSADQIPSAKGLPVCREDIR